MPQASVASESSPTSMGLYQPRCHLQSRNSIAVEDGVDFALALLDHTFQFIAQCGVPLAHSHRDGKCERQRRNINLRLNWRELQNAAIAPREESCKRSPYNRSVHFAIGDSPNDGIGIFTRRIKSDDLV